MHCVISALPLVPAPAHTPPSPVFQLMEQSCVSNSVQSSGLWLCICVCVCTAHACWSEAFLLITLPSLLSGDSLHWWGWQCAELLNPQILITTFNLLFFIFLPPSHNMSLSYCPRNCLHLAVCSNMERRIPSYSCGYQKAQWGTRLMEVACDPCMFSCTWESHPNIWKKDVLSA